LKDVLKGFYDFFQKNNGKKWSKTAHVALYNMIGLSNHNLIAPLASPLGLYI
jgi:hypothetical protein